MTPGFRKLMVWACVLAQIVFLVGAFNAIRVLVPAVAGVAQRAGWTMLPNPTRLLLGNAGWAATFPLILVFLLSTALAVVYLRVRDEADQLACALMVQVVFWVLAVTYVGAVFMAAALPFIHIAGR